MTTMVLYHAHCPDGFGAALACWLKFSDETTQYIPVTYGTPPPYEKIGKDNDLYLVDFSYDREQLKALAIDHTVTVIDHHKTAQAALENLHHARITTIFDMSESGATLTWKALFPDATLPELFRYLRDRDLWLWELPQSKEVSAALRSYPTDFQIWQSFLDSSQIEPLAMAGTHILRHIDKQVAALVRAPQYQMIGEHSVPCINTGLYGSEVGNLLCENHPSASFAICFSQQTDGRWRWELRSIGDFDVSEIAKIYGGGGHKNAAGCIVDHPPTYQS